MNCDWQATDYERTATGQRVYFCARYPRCNHVAFNDDHKRPIIAQCLAPKFELGNGVEAGLKSVGLTRTRWMAIKQTWNNLFHDGKKAKPCECEKRRKRLNNLFSKPLPYFVYMLLVLVGKTKPLPSKVEHLLANGKIRPLGVESVQGVQP